jgi:hypothetical protein
MTTASPTLLRLIYASRVTPRGAADVDNVLESILADAVPLNRKRGLTSVLITHDGWFLQGLEGSPGAVHEAYASIAKDSRHRNSVIRAEEQTAERLFPRWSLCARSLSVADAALVSDLAAGGRFDPAAAPPQTLVRLLSIISKAHDHHFDAQQRMIVRR